MSRFPVLRDHRGYVRGYLQYLSFDIPLVFRMLLRPRPDVYLVEPPPTTGAVVRVVAALQARPYVYDAADVWSDAARLTTRSRAVLALLRRMELFALGGATNAVTISPAVADRFRALGARVPFTVTGFGVDIDAFGLPSGVEPLKQFVYPGTFSEVHGAEIFVDAFARFSEENPGYRLVFIGNGSSAEALARRCEDHGLRDARVERAVPPGELAELLSRSTAALASVLPGTGYEYALATKVYAPLAVGCPVIFAGAGPTARVIEDDSTDAPHRGTVTSYDVAAVAAAMADYVTHPLSADDRQRLSTWSRERHDIRRVASNVIEVLSMSSAAREAEA